MGTRRIQMRHHVGEHFLLGPRRVDPDHVRQFIVVEVVPLVLVVVNVPGSEFAHIGGFSPDFGAFLAINSMLFACSRSPR